jgi:hypothetical protein
MLPHSVSPLMCLSFIYHNKYRLFSSGWVVLMDTDCFFGDVRIGFVSNGKRLIRQPYESTGRNTKKVIAEKIKILLLEDWTYGRASIGERECWET